MLDSVFIAKHNLLGYNDANPRGKMTVINGYAYAFTNQCVLSFILIYWNFFNILNSSLYWKAILSR